MIEATGALRNLVIEGGSEVCGEIFNKGCLKALTTLLERMLARLTAQSEAAGGMNGVEVYKKSGVKAAAELARSRAKLWVLAENVITVLSCLAYVVSGYQLQRSG